MGFENFGTKKQSQGGSGGFGFGSARSQPKSSNGFSFGNSQRNGGGISQNQVKSKGFGFGNKNNQQSGFKQPNNNSNGFGAQQQNNRNTGFGFGQRAPSSSNTSNFGFGKKSSNSGFGQSQQQPRQSNNFSTFNQKSTSNFGFGKAQRNPPAYGTPSKNLGGKKSTFLSGFEDEEEEEEKQSVASDSEISIDEVQDNSEENTLGTLKKEKVNFVVNDLTKVPFVKARNGLTIEEELDAFSAEEFVLGSIPENIQLLGI